MKTKKIDYEKICEKAARQLKKSNIICNTCGKKLGEKSIKEVLLLNIDLDTFSIEEIDSLNNLINLKNVWDQAVDTDCIRCTNSYVKEIEDNISMSWFGEPGRFSEALEAMR